MKITVEIHDDTAMHINKLIELTEEGNNSHGKLTIERLAEMLLQDVAMVRRRPGSWEGTNMAQVLASHGYEF